MSTALESRFALVFEAAPQAMFVATLSGHVIAMNRAMRSFVGLVNTGPASIPELLSSPEQMCDIMERIVEDGQFSELDVEFLACGGTPLTLRLSGHKLPDDASGECFMASALRVPEAAAATESSDATTGRRFERMASTVAHDLNNVLSAMAGYCHVLRDSIGRNDQALADLVGVEEAADRAAAIVRQLSAIGQRQILRPVTLNPATRIESREQVLRKLLPRGVDLQITSVRAGAEIAVDPDVFDEIVMILAINARKSMPDGGWLHVRTSAAPNDCEVYIDVMDTGASRRAFTIGKTFDPFASADAGGPYSALALAAVHALVVRSGGTITAESAAGFGTTFRVVFPVVDRLAMKAPAQAATADVTVRPRSARIFVVDDDAALRMLTERVLTLQGHHVIEARSGEEALAILETLEQPIDLAIIDLMMPGIKGWEVGRAVRARYPECGLIYMSGYNDARVRGELTADSLFLSKPFTPPKLTGIVGDALRSRQEKL